MLSLFNHFIYDCIPIGLCHEQGVPGPKGEPGEAPAEVWMVHLKICDAFRHLPVHL